MVKVRVRVRVWVRFKASGDLIGVDVDDFLHMEGEHNVQKQNLVATDNALLFGLCMEPLGPLVRHELKIESVSTRGLGSRKPDMRVRAKAYFLAIFGTRSLNFEERKFLSIQNFTRDLVFLTTLGSKSGG